jgi:hypothetical protein
MSISTELEQKIDMAWTTKTTTGYFLQPDVTFNSLFSEEIVSSFNASKWKQNLQWKNAAGAPLPNWQEFKVKCVKDITKILFAYFTFLNSEKSNILSGKFNHTYKFSINENIHGIPADSLCMPIGEILPKIVTACTLISRNFRVFKDLIGNDIEISVVKAQPVSLFLDIKPIVPQSKISIDKLYKLHLTVKPSFQLFAFMKLALLINEYYKDLVKPRALRMKMIVDSKAINPLPSDSIIRGLNGGPMPGIVYYTEIEDENEMLDLLKYIIPKFSEESEIGLMTLDDKDSLPYGNVRINHLFCYAQGDRIRKLDKQYADLALPEKDRSIKSIPKWIKGLKEGCSSESVKNKRKSQQFLGIDLCEGSTLNDKCVDDICYTATDDSLLNPDRILSLGGSRKIRRRKNLTKKRKNRKNRKYSTV